MAPKLHIALVRNFGRIHVVSSYMHSNADLHIFLAPYSEKNLALEPHKLAQSVCFEPFRWSDPAASSLLQFGTGLARENHTLDCVRIPQTIKQTSLDLAVPCVNPPVFKSRCHRIWQHHLGSSTSFFFFFRQPTVPNCNGSSSHMPPKTGVELHICTNSSRLGFPRVATAPTLAPSLTGPLGHALVQDPNLVAHRPSFP